MITEKYYKKFHVRKDGAVTIPPAIMAALGLDYGSELEVEYNRAERSVTYTAIAEAPGKEE